MKSFLYTRKRYLRFCFPRYSIGTCDIFMYLNLFRGTHLYLTWCSLPWTTTWKQEHLKMFYFKIFVVLEETSLTWYDLSNIILFSVYFCFIKCFFMSKIVLQISLEGSGYCFLICGHRPFNDIYIWPKTEDVEDWEV